LKLAKLEWLNEPDLGALPLDAAIFFIVPAHCFLHRSSVTGFAKCWLLYISLGRDGNEQ
jgi:hypothetical protein